MTTHLRRDIEHLERELLLVGSLVEEAINKAIRALVDRRLDLCEQVIRGDDVIDRKEVEVEEECLKILALHQPMAFDLRFLVVVLKVNNDLERMADLAVNIAERVSSLARTPPLPVALDFATMVDTVQQMVRGSLDALVRQDPALARHIIDQDDVVDDCNRQMFAILQKTMRERPDLIEPAVHTLSASRNLERIADLATNLAEDVVFMVEGEVIRHARLK
ncbi:MAG: phosphate signaling complex protein PhoU [Planctomycetes bacterium]|nr:phosphate signaling complex protein PhoU [Planctomycetota bacterium]